ATRARATRLRYGATDPAPSIAAAGSSWTTCRGPASRASSPQDCKKHSSSVLPVVTRSDAALRPHKRSERVFGLGADLEVLERGVGVDARILREPEHALGDDVAHHLVGAAGDAHAGNAEHHPVPGERPPLPGVGDE